MCIMGIVSKKEKKKPTKYAFTNKNCIPLNLIPCIIFFRRLVQNYFKQEVSSMNLSLMFIST